MHFVALVVFCILLVTILLLVFVSVVFVVCCGSVEGIVETFVGAIMYGVLLCVGLVGLGEGFCATIVGVDRV